MPLFIKTVTGSPITLKSKTSLVRDQISLPQPKKITESPTIWKKGASRF